MNEKENKQRRWNIGENFANFYAIAGGLSVLLVLLAIGGFIFFEQITDFSMNAFTEFISVIGTIFIVDRLARHRSEKERKEELIFQLGSHEPVIALSAANILDHRGWLRDGSLRNAKLQNANLKGAYIAYSDFENADLWYTNFEKAHLWYANLRNASLRNAKLACVGLSYANLSGADLSGSDLSGSHLNGANLRGANLKDANLAGADLYLAKLEGSILPDGNYWTPHTNICDFTNGKSAEISS